MEQRSGSLTFGRSDDPGPRTATQVFNFTAPVRQAVAVLAGTDFGFSRPDGDHHMGRVTTVLDLTVDDDVVTVEGSFGVRDWSEDWDDDYQGSMQFLLLAELASGVQPSNLSITGVEHTQAVQHFRSELHLDPATAGPDNHIPLVAGKDTVLRVYVDTGDDPTRPTIGQVTGLLEVRVPGGVWTSVSPLNGPLAPVRDEEIRRDDPDATLNFLIPGAFATDRLDIRVRAFDAATGDRPDLGVASGSRQESLRFRSVEPLRVRGVLVNYTGTPPVPVPVPVIADLRSTLSFVEQTFPVGDVIITGVDVIDDDGDYTDMSGDGCGTGWGGLLDTLRDMRGDREDIYYGLLPSGVPLGWGGCGGGGVAAGPVGAGSTAAQEIAHAFDREHAPCGNPGDPDPAYPVYGTLPAGSIGEFGMDAAGRVLDPATVEDFMSYCSPTWVSPYTYLGLLSRFPAQSSGTARAAGGRSPGAEPIAEHLFLRFRILRGGTVEPAPSFHFRSRRLPHRGRPSPYVVELRDCFDRPLQARRVLLTDPHTDLDSAQLSVTEQLPMTEDVARVVFLCTDGGCASRVLHTVDVPHDSPEVTLNLIPDCSREVVRVTWKAPDPDLTFLLRFSGDDGQTWRAVAPPTRARRLTVRTGALTGGTACRFQVLATSGIRTGGAVSEAFELVARPRTVLITSPAARSLIRGEPVVLEAEAFSPDSGSAAASEITWHSDQDGPLGHGRCIRFSSLTDGRHTVTASVADGCGARRPRASRSPSHRGADKDVLDTTAPRRGTVTNGRGSGIRQTRGPGRVHHHTEAMMLEIQTGSITFARDSGSGPRSGTDDVTFSGPVSTPSAVLTGMDYGFSQEDGDHHLGQVNIRVDAAALPGGTDVRVTATFGVRDWSGDWDDDYEGTVHFAVLAEV